MEVWSSVNQATGEPNFNLGSEDNCSGEYIEVELTPEQARKLHGILDEFLAKSDALISKRRNEQPSGMFYGEMEEPPCH